MNASIPIHRRLLSVALVCIAVIFAFLSQAPGGVPDKKKTCQVCGTHSSHDKPKTINIECKDVTAYLNSHPGSYAGPCAGVSGEKPPKP